MCRNLLCEQAEKKGVFLILVHWWRSPKKRKRKLYNKIQYELISPLNLLLFPGYVRLDYLSNIRSGISEEASCCALLSALLRETWRKRLLPASGFKAALQGCALETKHMFSSRLLREPTCYLYPRHRWEERWQFSCFPPLSLSKLPLIKRIKQSVIFSPHHSVCVAHCVRVCVPDASPVYI